MEERKKTTITKASPHIGLLICKNMDILCKNKKHALHFMRTRGPYKHIMTFYLRMDRTRNKYKEKVKGSRQRGKRDKYNFPRGEHPTVTKLDIT